MAYVGSSTNLRKRLVNHRSALRHRKHQNQYLQHAWDKYGIESFVFEVIELCDESQQIAREQHHIDSLQSHVRGRGYNICPSAEKRVFATESREKMSASGKGRKRSPESIELSRLAQIGRKRLPETVEKIRQKHLGSKRSAETRERLRISHLGKGPSAEALQRLHASNVGAKRTPETLERMRASMLAYHQRRRAEDERTLPLPLS